MTRSRRDRPFERTRLARGIWQDAYSIYVRAQAKGQRRAQRFPFGTPVSELKEWQKDREHVLRTQAPRDTRGTLKADTRRYLKQVRYLASHASLTSELKAWTALYGHLRRSAITAEHVRLAVSTWTEAGVAPKTIRNRINALRQLYHVLDARDDAPGEVPPTPADRLKFPKTQKRRPVYVAPAVIIGVAAELEQQLPAKLTKKGAVSQHWIEAQRTRARFMVIAATGVRPSQLKRVERIQVDLERRVWTVTAAKDGEPIGLYLNTDMLFAWRLFAEVEAWGDFDTRSYARRLRAAGWPKDIRPYNARHAVGIDLSELGVDLDDIREWMGHSDVETTRSFYVPVLASRLKRISEQLDGRLGWGEKGPTKGARKAKVASKPKTVKAFTDAQVSP